MRTINTEHFFPQYTVYPKTDNAWSAPSKHTNITFMPFISLIYVYIILIKVTVFIIDFIGSHITNSCRNVNESR